MPNVAGYAAYESKSPLQPFSVPRRDPEPTDVEIDILYCGVCHSDLHQVRDDWGGSVFPIVPGHEIVGRVSRVGDSVRKFSVGQLAAVGCMVDSCRSCCNCSEGLEQYCTQTPTWTYNVPDRKRGGVTYGGYSKRIVVDEAFVLRVSDESNLPGVAPLLCAGITTYSPLKHWQAGPGKKVGIIGLGGLGHMGVNLAHALDAHVVLFTRSKNKIDDGKRLGANEVVLSSDSAAMQQHASSFDLIIDTVSAMHDLNEYFTLLKRDGHLVQVGLPGEPMSVNVPLLIGRRGSLTGSGIGGIAETQEMLDFCAQRGIASDVEVISIQDINSAYERLAKGDVKYRFVIDMASLT